MRHVTIQVPAGKGSQAVKIVEHHHAVNLACFDASDGHDAIQVVSAQVPNGAVGPLIRDLRQIPQVRITMAPQGVFFFKPPDAQVPPELTHVQNLSPIEILLGGLQSIGSWKGFLTYAAGAACLVWIAFFTNSLVLLIAGMLVSPFAGPAMNVAIATARGDSKLLGRSLIRYLAALIVAALVAGGFSLLLGTNTRTTLMVDFSQVSEVAALLPLVVGTAGAANLIQSNRNSLVSGTAVGVLVGASLAPPAALIGIALVLGETSMLSSALFLVTLQLLGINLAGVIVFRLAGLSPDLGHFNRGKDWLAPLVLVITALLLAGLLVWQFSDPPNLQRSSQAQRAATEAKLIVEDYPAADLVEVSARFTRANIKDQNTLLVVVYVQRVLDSQRPAEVVREQLTQQIQTGLLQQGFEVTPLVDVVVLEPPG